MMGDFSRWYSTEQATGRCTSALSHHRALILIATGQISMTQPYIDASPTGYVPAPNLISRAGSVGPTYADADWELAIRYGVAQDDYRIVVLSSDPTTHSPRFDTRNGNALST